MQCEISCLPIYGSSKCFIIKDSFGFWCQTIICVVISFSIHLSAIFIATHGSWRRRCVALVLALCERNTDTLKKLHLFSLVLEVYLEEICNVRTLCAQATCMFATELVSAKYKQRRPLPARMVKNDVMVRRHTVM